LQNIRPSGTNVPGGLTTPVPLWHSTG